MEIKNLASVLNFFKHTISPFSLFLTFDSSHKEANDVFGFDSDERVEIERNPMNYYHLNMIYNKYGIPGGLNGVKALCYKALFYSGNERWVAYYYILNIRDRVSIQSNGNVFVNDSVKYEVYVEFSADSNQKMNMRFDTNIKEYGHNAFPHLDYNVFASMCGWELYPAGGYYVYRA